MSMHEDWSGENPFAPPPRSYVAPAIVAALALMVVVTLLVHNAELALDPPAKRMANPPSRPEQVAQPRMAPPLPLQQRAAHPLTAQSATDESPTSTIYLCVTIPDGAFGPTPFAANSERPLIE